MRFFSFEERTDFHVSIAGTHIDGYSNTDVTVYAIRKHLRQFKVQPLILFHAKVFVSHQSIGLTFFNIDYMTQIG